MHSSDRWSGNHHFIYTLLGTGGDEIGQSEDLANDQILVSIKHDLFRNDIAITDENIFFLKQAEAFMHGIKK